MSIADIRNVALVGHGGTGKTTLCEAILFKTKTTHAKGSIDAKNTVSDYNEDEKERGCSLEVGVLHAKHNGKTINLFDSPGTPDFVGGVVEALAAADVALICVNAAAGIEVVTRKVWGMTAERGMPRMIVITRMDNERADFDKCLEQCKEVFGASVAPVMIPVGSGGSFKGVVSLLGDLAGAPSEVAEKAKDLKGTLTETIVAADDALMERYLGDEAISKEELANCFVEGMLAQNITPVLCVAAGKDELGVAELIEILAEQCPSAAKARPKLFKKEEEKVLEPKDDGTFYAQVFRSKRDAFVGKISYIRVYSGTLPSGGAARVNDANKPEKFAHFLSVQGKETKETPAAHAGEVVAIAKHDSLSVGDTLTGDDSGFLFRKPFFPVPMSALAVQAKNRNEEGKVSEQLRHIAESDQTFTVEVDPETKELVIHGMGQLHLDLMLARLKKIGIGVETKPPKIPYRSTVASSAEVRYRHKKQSGGSGQFGEVQVLVEPNPGKGYEFVDEIVGGVIPHNLIPSVDKGITKKLAEGVWPGIPVVDVRVRLNDGKSHPVDSKDVAFQIAGREAFKQAFEKAKPVLIEPFVKLEVVIPAKYMGDITGHLSGLRGRVQGMDQMGDLQVVKAEAPASAVQNYAADLKAMTGGEGFYSMEFSHYDTVPSNVAAPVIEAAKSRQKGEED